MRNAILASFLAPVAALCAYAPLNTIQVLPIKNGRVVTTSYAMREDSWLHPRLRRLREREKLDEVAAPGRTQFEKIVLLRRWAHRQWEAGPGPFYYPAWDALEILDLARHHGNRAFCAQYAVLFLQSCRALGLHARYLDLGHFITSVWSDEFNRWVVMDPTNDLHYERDGAPMGDLELIRAAQRGLFRDILVVRSDGSREPITAEQLRPFRDLSVCLLNDQLTNPAIVIQNGRKRVLAAGGDFRDYPVVGKDKIGYGNFCLAWGPSGQPPPATRNPVSQDRDDLRQDLDQTVIFFAGRHTSQGMVKLRLFTETTPEFAAFVGGPEGLPPAELTPHVSWSLKPGLNVFTARVRTAAGWLGPESRIPVFYKPSWLKSVSYRLRLLL